MRPYSHIAISCRSQTGIWPASHKAETSTYTECGSNCHGKLSLRFSWYSTGMESLRSRLRQQSFVLPSGATQAYCKAPLLAAQVPTSSCSPSQAVQRGVRHCITGYYEPQMHAASRNVHLWNEGMSDISNVECRRSRRPTIHVE